MKILVLFFLFQFCLVEINAQDVDSIITPSQSSVVIEVSKKNMSLSKNHYNIATKKSNKGDKNGAVIEYKEAIILNPYYIEACNDIAIAFLDLKNYDMALYYFNMALSIQPDYQLAKKNKSVVFLLQGNDQLNVGNNQEAILYYQDIISLDPNYLEAYNNAAIAYLRLENFDMALEYLNMALIVNPRYELAQNNMIEVYCKQGSKKLNAEDYQGAIIAYQSAININQKHLQAYNDIAIVYIKLEDFNKAIIFLDKALTIKPYYELTMENKAIAYLKRGTKKIETGDNEGAASDYIESINSNPFCEEAYIKTATAFMKMGDQSMSQRYTEKSLEIKEAIIKRNEAKVYYSEGSQKYALQNYQGAIQEYSKAIRIYPNYFEAYNDRGSAYNYLREYNKAIDDFNMSLKINPNYGIAQKNKDIVQQFKKERTIRTLNTISMGLNTLSSTLNTINNTNSNSYTPQNNTNNNNRGHLENITCNLCKGTGFNPGHNTGTCFGQESYHYCDVCKKGVPCSHGAHGRCPGCRGKGSYQKFVR